LRRLSGAVRGDRLAAPARSFCSEDFGNQLLRSKLSWASSGRSAVIRSETAVQFAVIAFEQVVRELQPLESVHQSLCKRRRSLHEPGSKTLRRVDVASRAT